MACSRGDVPTTPPSDARPSARAPQAAAEPTAAPQDGPGPLDPGALMRWAERTEDIDAMIHPEHGMFMVHNISGSVPHLEWVRRWPTDEDTMLDTLFDPAAGLEAMRQAPAWADLYREPGTDGECDEGSEHMFDAADPTAHTLDIHLGMRWDDQGDAEVLPPWITRSFDELEPGAVEALSGIGDTQWDADAWTHLQVLTAATMRGAFVRDISLYFGVLDGEWYLVGLDAYDDACG